MRNPGSFEFSKTESDHRVTFQLSESQEKEENERMTKEKSANKKDESDKPAFSPYTLKITDAKTKQDFTNY